MIEIVQQTNLAIGSKKAVSGLAGKEFAKVLLISDSHGNSVILQDIIAKFGPDCDAMCFCGDGLLDLIETFELAFFDKEFGKKMPEVVYFVRGNGDNSTTTIFTEQRIPVTVPEFQEIEIAGKKIFLTHGHRYNVYYGIKDLKNEAIERGMDIVWYGHTHVPNSIRSHVSRNGHKDFFAVSNPGSCAQARGGMPNSFSIMEVHREAEKNICHYYRITRDKNDEPVFSEMPTPRGEIRLF
ncbi:metallophosphoesterase family protein [Treponema sp.]|uniref:metallophosphoesterase family protein n=1 Tax=Treponema sp. TaxID=166 RepID=UPI003890C614